MKKLESINNEKFQVLTDTEIADVNGGRIFPQRGTSSLGWTMLNNGGSAHYSSDWRTGWFSSNRDSGAAYLDESD
jgi:hypothetical protein